MDALSLVAGRNVRRHADRASVVVALLGNR